MLACLNVQSLTADKPKLKVNCFSKCTEDNDKILMSITETWLNESIPKEADIEIMKLFMLIE